MGKQARYQLWIVAAASVIFFTNLGGTALWDMDEALYSTCAREMFQRGDWVVPMFNGQMFPEKPPLMFWTMMAGFELFGVNEWGARFFSAVLGVGTALVAFHLGRILANDRVGLWTGLITASTLIFTISARAATVDSALTFVTTLAFLMFAIGWKKAARSGLPAEGSGVDDAGKPDPVLYTPGPENLNADPKTQNAKSAANALGFVEKAPTPLGSHSERSEESAQEPMGTKRSFAPLRMTTGFFRQSLEMPYAVVMYACIGLAVLGKGPVGMLLPLAAMGLFLLVARGWRKLLSSARWMRPVTALLVVAAVAVPWYAWVGVRTHGEWLRVFFVEFNLRPFRQPILSHGDVSSFDFAMAALVSILYYFYQIPAVLCGFFPWAVFLGPTLADTIQRIRRRDDWWDGCALASCWFGVWFLFWSICKTKLPHYLLPAYPALALLMALFIDRWQTAPGSLARWGLRNAWISMIVVGVGMTIAVPIVAVIFLPGETVLGLVGLIPVIGGGWCWWQTAHGRHAEALVAFAVTAVVFLTAIFGFAALRVDRHQNARPMIAAIRADCETRDMAVGKGSADQSHGRPSPEIGLAPFSPPIATYRFFRESTVFYAGYPVTTCDEAANRSARQDLREFLAKPNRSYVITTDEYTSEIDRDFPGRFHVLFRHPCFLRPGEMVVLRSQKKGVRTTFLLK